MKFFKFLITVSALTLFGASVYAKPQVREKDIWDELVPVLLEGETLHPEKDWSSFPQDGKGLVRGAFYSMYGPNTKPLLGRFRFIPPHKVFAAKHFENPMLFVVYSTKHHISSVIVDCPDAGNIFIHKKESEWGYITLATPAVERVWAVSACTLTRENPSLLKYAK